MKSSSAGLLAVVSVAVFVTSMLPAAARITPALVTNLPIVVTDLAASGHHLFTVGSGFQIFDISNPTNPVSSAKIELRLGGHSLALSDGKAYVIDGTRRFGGDLTIFDISTPTNPVAIGQIPGEWLTVTVSGRYAYLNGSIYDVSLPSVPIKVGQFDLGPADDTGRFVSVVGNHAYLAVNWLGLGVYDISNPADPVRVALTNSTPGGYAFEVQVSDGYAYLDALTNGACVYDISEPTHPVPISAVSGGFRGRALMAISGNYVFVPDWGFFSIWDVSDPSNATNVLSYLVGSTIAVAVSGNHAYLAVDGALSIYSLGISPPPLAITQSSGSTLRLSWPAPAPAFAIQQNNDLNPTNWVELTNAPTVVRSVNQVTIPAPVRTRFYRLVSP